MNSRVEINNYLCSQSKTTDRFKVTLEPIIDLETIVTDAFSEILGESLTLDALSLPAERELRLMGLENESLHNIILLKTRNLATGDPKIYNEKFLLIGALVGYRIKTQRAILSGEKIPYYAYENPVPWETPRVETQYQARIAAADLLERKVSFLDRNLDIKGELDSYQVYPSRALSTVKHQSVGVGIMMSMLLLEQVTPTFPRKRQFYPD